MLVQPTHKKRVCMHCTCVQTAKCNVAAAQREGGGGNEEGKKACFAHVCKLWNAMMMQPTPCSDCEQHPSMLLMLVVCLG